MDNLELIIILCTYSLMLLQLALLVFVVVVLSKILKRADRPVQAEQPREIEPATPRVELTKEQAARNRKEFEDEMSAFREMMNYNTDKAYGIEPEE